MKTIFPGHMKAVTWLLALVLLGVTYYTTRDRDVALGALLLVMGFFLADQATHLAQEVHSAEPPTWIERTLQRYTMTSIFAGLLLVGWGAFLMTKSLG